MTSKPNRSRTPPPCLLLESGALQEGEAARATIVRGVRLSRALCRFESFRAPAELSLSQVARAARTYAEANAPFADTGVLLLRAGQGVSIWYWDKQRLAELGAGEAREISPESVWRTAGDGWRVLACAEGYEAQYWQDGALRASSWRREPFSAEQWTAFVLSVDSFEGRAPETAPRPLALPADDASWRRAVVKPPLGWRDAERAALTVALCAAALATFFSGQALRHELAAQASQRQVARIELQLAQDPDIERARERAELLRSYAMATGGPDVAGAAADAFEAFGRFQLQPQSWRVDRERFTAVVDAAVSEAPVRELLDALEAMPRICPATPELIGAGSFEVSAPLARGESCEGGAQ